MHKLTETLQLKNTILLVLYIQVTNAKSKTYHVISPILVSFHAMTRKQNNVRLVIRIRNVPTHCATVQSNVFVPSESELLFSLLLSIFDTLFQSYSVVFLFVIGIHAQFGGRNIPNLKLTIFLYKKLTEVSTVK